MRIVRVKSVRTITIGNQKGGCGKTTVAINLSASLAREGRRVLLVDLDPQAHCALGMAVPEEQIDLSILDCLMGQVEGEPVELSRITWQIAPNLDLAPSRSNLGTLEPKLASENGADRLLHQLLTANEGRYDFCLVDCPPHLGLLMRNGLLAADEVVIPVDTGYFSLHGLTQQLATIEQLGERDGARPKARVLPNQYDVRTKLAREILAELRSRFEGVVFDTIINFNTKLKEGASFGQPITEFAPTSMGARDFQQLARELIAAEPVEVPAADLIQHAEKLAADAERLLATTATLVDNRTITEVVPAATTVEPMPESAAAPRAEQKPAWTAPEAREPLARAETRGNGRNVNLVPIPTPKAAPASRPATMPTHPRQPSPPPVTPSPARSLAHDIPGVAVPPTSLPAKAVPVQVNMPEVRPEPVATNAEIDRKIAAIYGVRQEGDVVIFCNRNPAAHEVQLAGDFNDWMPHTTPMRRMATGDFEARLRLPKGRYRYRLVIDGRWSHDHHNPLVEANEYGELNSVLEVAE